jgi:hypothetical protein
MLKLSLDLDINFRSKVSNVSRKKTLCGFGEGFKDCMINVYLDNRYKQKVFRQVCTLTRETFNVQLCGILPAGIIMGNGVPSDTRICIQIYRSVKNDEKKFCWVDNGFSSILLSNLCSVNGKQEISYFKKEVNQTVLKISEIKSDCVITLKDVVLDSCNLSDKGEFVREIFKYSSEFCDRISESVKWTGDNITNINQGMGLANSFRNYEQQHRMEKDMFTEALRGADGVECVFCPGEAQFSDQFQLPFASFVLCDSLNTNALFWLNQMEILMNKENLKLDDMVDFFINESPSIGTRFKCRFVIKLICQYVQVLDYIDDELVGCKTGKVTSNEVFGDASVCLCGDCDELAKFIFQLHKSFCNIKDWVIPTEGNASFINHSNLKNHTEFQILERLQLFAMVFVRILCVECVSGKNTRILKKNGIDLEIDGYHACVKFLDFQFFNECYQRWDENENLITSVITEMKKSTKEKYMNLYPDESLEDFDTFLRSLPVLCGEGTGDLDPLPMNDIFEEYRTYIRTRRSISKCKNPRVYPLRNNPFYKSVVWGATDIFFEKCHTGSFFFTYHPQLAIKTSIEEEMISNDNVSGKYDALDFSPGIKRKGFISGIDMVKNNDIQNDSVTISGKIDDLMRNCTKDLNPYLIENCGGASKTSYSLRQYRFSKNGKFTTSVVFEDLMGKNKSVMIVPYGFYHNGPNYEKSVISDTMVRDFKFQCEFTQLQMDVIKSGLTTRIPPNDILLDMHQFNGKDLSKYIPDYKFEEKRIMLESFKQNINNTLEMYARMNKRIVNKRKEPVRNKYLLANKLYCHIDDYLITSNFLVQLKDDLSSMTEYLESVDFIYEKHSEIVKIWRLDMYLIIQ